MGVLNASPDIMPIAKQPLFTLFFGASKKSQGIQMKERHKKKHTNAVCILNRNIPKKIQKNKKNKNKIQHILYIL